MQPTDTHILGYHLWTYACKRAMKIDWDTKWKFLTTTYKEVEKEESLKHKTYNEYVIQYFIRYLVQREYAMIKKTSPDQQPTPADLDAFFSREDNENGKFLADIHRQFPGVKNVPELMRRIERFATFRPASIFADCQEPVYVRKPIPSRADIQKILAIKPRSIQELLGEFPDGVGSEVAVVNTLKAIAAPDVTGPWILKTQKGPDGNAIWQVMGDAPKIFAGHHGQVPGPSLELGEVYGDAGAGRLPGG